MTITSPVAPSTRRPDTTCTDSANDTPPAPTAAEKHDTNANAPDPPTNGNTPAAPTSTPPTSTPPAAP
ncbi:hypothetical protein [Kitasatospora sp. NE20-6]|uniref:hypothetical protein n=1 Tax=Kitasatospora sp. NE20-6 TaxID=2859066 RepID=UPI0038B2BECD